MKYRNREIFYDMTLVWSNNFSGQKMSDFFETSSEWVGARSGLGLGLGLALGLELVSKAVLWEFSKYSYS